MNFDRILVTTDLSVESLRPARQLAGIVTERNVEVLLLHVVEDIPITPHGAPMAPLQHSPEVIDEQNLAREWLERHSAEIADDFINSVHVIRARNPAKAIVAFASEHDVDLIAMSTHGRTGFRHLIMGSVSEAVIRHADRPVLVFPRHQE